MQGTVRHAEIPKRGNSKWHARKTYSRAFDELGNEVNALHIYPAPVQKIRPVARTAANIEDGAIDTFCPSFNAFSVQIMHILDGSKKARVVGGACPIRRLNMFISHGHESTC